MAHDVFVSYASGDKAVADAVCATLESHGIRCWIAPRDVLPGLHYGEAIIDAIHECRIMVLVFSSKANLSGHIPKEIERAVSQGSTIMPLRIEDVLPAKSLDYFIGSVHWLDALTPPLESHLKRLSENVKTLLARNTAVPMPGVAPTIPPPPVAHAPIPPPPTKAPAKPVGMYALIVGLIAAVLVLGFLAMRTRNAGTAPTPVTSAPIVAESTPPAKTQPNASTVAVTPASVATEHPLAPPTSEKKVVAAAEPAAKPAAPIKSVAAKPSHGAESEHKLVFQDEAGGTVKLEQLIGDLDKERKQATRNQTFSKYGIEGAEIGYSFEHDGHAYFLFGDVIGHLTRWADAIASTDTTNPDDGVPLEFLTRERGKFLAIEPPAINMGINAIPVSGISLNHQMYVVVRTHDPKDLGTGHSVLTKFEPPKTFEPLHTISKLPSGHFLKMSLHEQEGTPAGLPPGGPWVLMWGSGSYRESDAYLAIIPEAQFEAGTGTRYFKGLTDTGEPQWSENETDAKPVLTDGTIGDLSVTWCKDLNLWLMTYDRLTTPNGIVLSYSRTPWGPWTEPQMLFNALVDGGYGKFIHAPHERQSDGLAGPVLMPRRQDDPEKIRGGAYAPYVVERWTKVHGSELDLYFTMSTQNPYVVVLMKSRIQVE